MQELNLRLGQAVALTYAQTDENFKRLKTAIDALEVAVAGAGLGTVTSVGLTLPNIFTVTNSPVTTTGSLTATLASQSANRLFASPDGSAGTPTFRSLVAADLGSITVPIANGGTGLNVPATANQVLASDGTNYEGRTISVSGGLTLTNSAGSIAFGINPALINITGFAGVLTVAKGGTGLSTPPANGALLIGNGTSYASATLTAGSGISITNGLGTITIANTATGVSQLNGFTGALNLSVDTANNDVQITNISPDIILSIPTASSTKRGALSSADWTTFNSKVGGSGTTNYIPKFTASGTIGNSVLYEDGSNRIGLGTATPTSTFHIVRGGANFNLETTNGIAALLKISSTSASTDVSINSGGTVTTTNTNLTVNTGFRVYPSGNAQFLKGFAIDGFVYWNVTGNYTFATNEQYGVILGTGSDATMTVNLPTSPMDGQEICILTEEDKSNLTIASGVALRNIYGKSGTPGVTVTFSISLNTHGSAVIFKYAAAGNGGIGAWYLTGF
jgi:hypothetical protein